MGLLESSLFRPIRAIDVIKWIAVVTGLGLGAIAAVIKYRNHKRDKVYVLDKSDAVEYASENGQMKHDLSSNDVNENLILDPFYVNSDMNKNVGNGKQKDAKKNAFQNLTLAEKSMNIRPLSIKLNSSRSAPISKQLDNQSRSEVNLPLSKQPFFNQLQSSFSNTSKETNTINSKLIEELFGNPTGSQSTKSSKNVNSSLELQTAIISSSVSNFPKLLPSYQVLPSLGDQSMLPDEEKMLDKDIKERTLSGKGNETNVIANKASVVQQGLDDTSCPSSPKIPNSEPRISTQEEIKSVEEDIRSFKAEIAKLMPSSNQNTNNQ